MSSFGGSVGCIYLCMPNVSPLMSSSWIHTTRLSHKTPCVVTNLTHLCEIKIPTPPLHAALELSELRSLRATSSIQLVHPSISLVPKFYKALPFCLCSWIITMSILGVKELIKLFSFAMLSGTFRPRILCEFMFHSITRLWVETFVNFLLEAICF